LPNRRKPNAKFIIPTTTVRLNDAPNCFIYDIAQQYPKAERITLVMDNLNTHTPASLYQTFVPEQAKSLWDRFEFVYTPKHGSWLNSAKLPLGG
jgi:hypothetical protein